MPKEIDPKVQSERGRDLDSLAVPDSNSKVVEGAAAESARQQDQHDRSPKPRESLSEKISEHHEVLRDRNLEGAPLPNLLVTRSGSSVGTSGRQNQELDEMQRQGQSQVSATDRKKKRRSEIPDSIREIVDLLETALPAGQLQEILETAVEGASSGSSLQLSPSEVRNLSKDIFEKIKHCLANGDLAADGDLASALEAFFDQAEDLLSDDSRKALAARLVELHEERRAERVIAAEKREALAQNLQPMLQQLRTISFRGVPGERFGELEEIAARMAALEIDFPWLDPSEYESLDELVESLAIVVQDQTRGQLTHREAYYLADLLYLNKASLLLLEQVEQSAHSELVRSVEKSVSSENEAEQEDLVSALSLFATHQQFFLRYPSLREHFEEHYEARVQALRSELSHELTEFAEVTTQITALLEGTMVDGGALAEALLRISPAHFELFLEFFEAEKGVSLSRVLSDVFDEQAETVITGLCQQDPVIVGSLHLAVELSQAQQQAVNREDSTVAINSQVESQIVSRLSEASPQLVSQYESLFGSMQEDLSTLTLHSQLLIRAALEKDSALTAAVQLKQRIENEQSDFTIEELVAFLRPFGPDERRAILERFQQEYRVDLLRQYSTGEFSSALFSPGITEGPGYQLHLRPEERTVRHALLDGVLSGDLELERIARIRTLILRHQQENVDGLHESSFHSLTELIAFYASQDQFSLETLQSRYRERFAEVLSTDIERLFDSASYLDQSGHLREGSGAGDARLREAERTLLHNMLRGETLHQESLLIVLEHDSTRLGAQLATERVNYRAQGNLHRVTEIQEQIDRLQELATTLAPQSSVAPEVVRLSVNEAYRSEFIPQVSREVWAMGRDHRKALDLDNDRLLPSQEEEFRAYLDALEITGELRRELERFYKESFDHVSARMNEARNLAHQLYEEIDGYNFSHSGAFELLTAGRFASARDIRDKANQAYLDRDILEYLPAAFANLTGGQSLYLRIENERWGSQAVEDKIQNRLLNLHYSSYSPDSRHIETLPDIERFAPPGLSGEQVIERLREMRPETLAAIELREALSSQTPVLTALEIFSRIDREAALAEYERLFGVSFVSDAERHDVERMALPDRERSQQEGVLRYRELANGFDMLVLLAQGTDRASPLFQNSLEEYAYVRLELLSRREGALAAGSVERLDLMRGSSFGVNDRLLAQVRREREMFESQLDSYFGADSEVRSFQRQFVQQAIRESAAEQFTKNVQVLRHQEQIAFGLAQVSLDGNHRRVSQRERTLVERYTRQVDPDGEFQRSEKYQEFIANCEHFDGQTNEDLRQALTAAKNLHDALDHTVLFFSATNEDLLNETLRGLSPQIRNLTIQVFEARYQKNLRQWIREDTSGGDAQEALARYAGENLFAEQVVLFRASVGWGSSESRIQGALERSAKILDTRARQELYQEGQRLLVQADRMARVGLDDEQATALRLEAQAIIRAARTADPNNERYQRRFREGQLEFSQSFDQAYAHRGMTFDTELLTDDELDDPELARAIWNQPSQPDSRLMLDFRSTLDGNVNGAARILQGEVNTFLDTEMQLTIPRDDLGRLSFTVAGPDGVKRVRPEFRSEVLEMFANWAAHEAAAGRLHPGVANAISQGSSLSSLLEDRFRVPNDEMVALFERFYSTQILQPRYLPLLADGSILSPNSGFEFSRNQKGERIFAGEPFSYVTQMHFREWVQSDSGVSAEIRELVRRHNGPLQELLVQRQDSHRELVELYERFYSQEVLKLHEIRARFEERIDELDQIFQQVSGENESLREYARRESAGAGRHSVGWILSLLDGDLVEAQSHQIRRGVAGAGTYDQVLEDALRPHDHVFSRMQDLERQLWELRSTHGAQVKGYVEYVALQQEFELYSSRVRSRFSGVESHYREEYGDIWKQIRGDVDSARYAVLRSVAENGTLSRAAQVQLALGGKADGTDEDLLRSVLTGLSKEELEQLALDFYEMKHQLSREDRENLEVQKALDYFRGQLSSELSGDDWYDVRVLLVGEPETVDQMWEVIELHKRHVRGARGSWATDMFGEADEQFDEVYAEFRLIYFRDYKGDNPAQRESAERRLRALFQNANISAQSALQQRNQTADSVIDTVTTAVVVGGAVAAGAFSFGAGTIVILTAAAAVGRIGGGVYLKGGSYGAGQFGTDVGMTAVDFATMGAGRYISMGARRVSGSLVARAASKGLQSPAAQRAAARIAAESSQETAERVGATVASEAVDRVARETATETAQRVATEGAQQQFGRQTVREFLSQGPLAGEASWQWGVKLIDSRLSTRMLMNTTEGALDGSITGFALGVGQAASHEQTWSQGFGQGMRTVLSAGGQNALVGGLFGAQFGGAMGMMSRPGYLFDRRNPESIASLLESGNAPQQRTLTVERRLGEITDRVSGARERASEARRTLDEIRLGNREASRSEIRELRVQSREDSHLRVGEREANIEADLKFRGSDDIDTVVARDKLATVDAELRTSKREQRQRFTLAIRELVQPNLNVRKRFADFSEALGEWRLAGAQVKANRAQYDAALQQVIVAQGAARRLQGLETVSPQLKQQAVAVERAKLDAKEALFPWRGESIIPDLKKSFQRFRDFQKSAETVFNQHGKQRIQESLAKTRKASEEKLAGVITEKTPPAVAETLDNLREGMLSARGRADELVLQRAEAWARLRRGQFPGWEALSLSLGREIRMAQRGALRKQNGFEVSLALPEKIEARLSIIDTSQERAVERAIDLESLALQRQLDKQHRAQDRLRVVTDLARGRFFSAADDFRSFRAHGRRLAESRETIRGLRRQTDLDILEHYAKTVLPENPDLAAKWALETARIGHHLAARRHPEDHGFFARFNYIEQLKAIPAYLDRRPTQRQLRAVEFEMQLARSRDADYQARYDIYLNRVGESGAAVARRLAHADIDVKSTFERMRNAYVERIDALIAKDFDRVREFNSIIKEQRRQYLSARRRRSEARTEFEVEKKVVDLRAERPDIPASAVRREAEAQVLFSRSLSPFNLENPVQALERKLARQRHNRALQLEQERFAQFSEQLDPNNQADVKLAHQRASAERTYRQRKREYHAIRGRYKAAIHTGRSEELGVLEARLERKQREFQRASAERRSTRERFKVRQREFSIAQETESLINSSGMDRSRASRLARANYDSREALRKGRLLTALQERGMAVYLREAPERFSRFERKFQEGATALGEGQAALTLAHARADAWRQLDQARRQLRRNEQQLTQLVISGRAGDLEFNRVVARQAQLREEFDVARTTYKTVNNEYKAQVRERRFVERAVREAEAEFGIDGDLVNTRSISSDLVNAVTAAKGRLVFLRAERLRERFAGFIDRVKLDGEGLAKRKERQQQLANDLQQAKTDLRRAREHAHLRQQQNLISRDSFADRVNQQEVREALVQSARARARLDEASGRPLLGLVDRLAARRDIRQAEFVLAPLKDQHSFARRKEQHVRELLSSPERAARDYRRQKPVQEAAETYATALTHREDLSSRLNRELSAVRRGNITALREVASTSIEMAKARISESRASRRYHYETRLERLTQEAHAQLGKTPETLEIAGEFAVSRAERNRLFNRTERVWERVSGILDGRRRFDIPSQALTLELRYQEAASRFREAQRRERYSSVQDVIEAVGKLRAAEVEKLAARREGRAFDSSSLSYAKREMRIRERTAKSDIRAVANAAEQGIYVTDPSNIAPERSRRVSAQVDQSRTRASIASVGPRPERNMLDEVVALTEELDGLQQRLAQARAVPEKRALEVDIRNTKEQIAHLSGRGGEVPDEFGLTPRDYESLLSDMRVQVEHRHQSLAAREDGLDGSSESAILGALENRSDAQRRDSTIEDLYRRQSQLVRDLRTASESRQHSLEVELDRIADEISVAERKSSAQADISSQRTDGGDSSRGDDGDWDAASVRSDGGPDPDQGSGGAARSIEAASQERRAARDSSENYEGYQDAVADSLEQQRKMDEGDYDFLNDVNSDPDFGGSGGGFADGGGGSAPRGDGGYSRGGSGATATRSESSTRRVLRMTPEESGSVARMETRNLGPGGDGTFVDSIHSRGVLEPQLQPEPEIADVAVAVLERPATAAEVSMGGKVDLQPGRALDPQLEPELDFHLSRKTQVATETVADPAREITTGIETKLATQTALESGLQYRLHRQPIPVEHQAALLAETRWRVAYSQPDTLIRPKAQEQRTGRRFRGGSEEGYGQSIRSRPFGDEPIVSLLEETPTWDPRKLPTFLTIDPKDRKRVFEMIKDFWGEREVVRYTEWV